MSQRTHETSSAAASRRSIEMGLADTATARPRAAPNGAQRAAPRTGSPEVTAAAATAAKVPNDRYVKKPAPRPSPYKAAAVFGEKNVLHHSGTCRLSWGSGTGHPNASRPA